MNITAHQEKKKNEEMKTGMKKAEGKKQATDFREAVCCLVAVIQGVARRKNGLWGVSGVTGTFGKANSHFDPSQTESGTALPR